MGFNFFDVLRVRHGIGPDQYQWRCNHPIGRCSNCNASPNAPVGLNGFQLVFSFPTETVALFSFAVPGDAPIPFSLVSTDPSVLSVTELLTLVGWSAYLDAPEGLYHVATLAFSGSIDPSFTFDLLPANSSLGSCIAGGAGPDAIPVSSSSVHGNFSIESVFPLTLLPGLPSWLNDDPTYDLVAPFGAIDVLDLVKIATCAN